MLNQADKQSWNNMCHELRTPLSAILGISEILMQPGCSAQKQKEYLSVLHDTTSVLKSYMEGMLDFARLDAGKIHLAYKPFNPMEVIFEAARITNISAEAKNLTMEMHLGPLPPQLIGDAIRVEQITLNLLSNAIKFTHSGYVRLESWGQCKDNTCELIIKVTDSGIGIPPEKHKAIFTRFQQADESTQHIYGGSGLGLAICKELATLMNGTIEVDSDTGKGACFTVNLKLAV